MATSLSGRLKLTITQLRRWLPHSQVFNRPTQPLQNLAILHQTILLVSARGTPSPALRREAGGSEEAKASGKKCLMEGPSSPLPLESRWQRDISMFYASSSSHTLFSSAFVIFFTHPLAVVRAFSLPYTSLSLCVRDGVGKEGIGMMNA
jgi:hypothetical protein